MSELKIVAVAGPPGAGKTAWIQEQLKKLGGLASYFSPNAFPIDSVRLGAEFPELRLIKSLEAEVMPLFVEVGAHLDLDAFRSDDLDRIAIVPPKSEKSEWHLWADAVIASAEVEMSIGSKLWRAETSGAVIDIESLEVLWEELILGAYGKVSRAKAVFVVADGRTIYGEYASGANTGIFSELPLPRWLDGPPQIFSGIEVFSDGLDEASVATTLRQCCLSEEAMTYYQQQAREMLAGAS
jgi:hypothetical protein